MGSVMGGRAFDRLVNFSDAVVAVAVTIMVLPVTQIPGPTGTQSMIDVLRTHWPLLLTYLLTFAVIAMLWGAHHRAFDSMRAYDGTIFWLTIAWLATIALLPWPIALIDEDEPGTYVPTLYLALVAVSSFLLYLTARHASRHRELLENPDDEGPSTRRGLVFAAVFALGAVITVVLPSLTGITFFAFAIAAIVARPGALTLRRTAGRETGQEAE